MTPPSSECFGSVPVRAALQNIAGEHLMILVLETHVGALSQ
jgi:hypothetical protein